MVETLSRAADCDMDRVGPSSWVTRFAALVPAGNRVLDVACGPGRHSRLFLTRGHPVLAVDRDLSGLADLSGEPGLVTLRADLEDGRRFPLVGQRFGAVVVTYYLHRPILADLVDAVAPGGILLYETFTAGHEGFGRTIRPEFVLRPGELLDLVRGELRVVAYEDVVVDGDAPAAIQRIAAVRDAVAL